MQVTSSTIFFTMVWGWGIVVPVPVLQNIPCRYLLWLVRWENPLLLTEVSCKTYVGMRTHSCVALQMNTNIHIFLTHSFGAQIEHECRTLYNMQQDQSEQRLKLWGWLQVSPLTINPPITLSSHCIHHLLIDTTPSTLYIEPEYQIKWLEIE